MKLEQSERLVAEKSFAKAHEAYEALATKFFQHYIYVGAAMKKMGGRRYQLWDEEDGFFYDVLRLPDGSAMRLKVRSMVGLLPLCACTTFEADVATRHPRLLEGKHHDRHRYHAKQERDKVPFEPGHVTPPAENGSLL